MTIRIYALAKDLKVESKVLIDLCPLLGIKEKANALTNLTDDDVEKIKNHLAKQSQKTVVDFNAPPANNAPIQSSHPKDYGKIPDLTQRFKSRPKQEETDKTKDVKPKATDSEPAKTEQTDVKPAQPEPVSETTDSSDVTAQQSKPTSDSQPEVKTEKTDAEPIKNRFARGK